MNDNSLRCVNHPDRVMYDTCDKCKKFLCKECAKKYPSGLCDECEAKRVAMEPIIREKLKKEESFLKTINAKNDLIMFPIIFVVSLIIGLLATGNIIVSLIIGYIVVGTYLGWSYTHKSIPKVTGDDIFFSQFYSVFHSCYFDTFSAYRKMEIDANIFLSIILFILTPILGCIMLPLVLIGDIIVLIKSRGHQL